MNDMSEVSTGFIEVLAISYLARKDIIPKREYLELRKILPKVTRRLK